MTAAGVLSKSDGDRIVQRRWMYDSWQTRQCPTSDVRGINFEDDGALGCS
jgi:hypothetical protein